MQTRTYWNQYNMTFRDTVFGPSQGGSIWQLCPLSALLDPSVATVFYDDFFNIDTTNDYTVVEDAGAGGTDGILDAANGVYKHFCDGDDNDEAYLTSVNESWKFAAGKSLWFECRAAFHEGSTNKMNWILGLMDAAGANAIVDNGAGPAATYDGAVFYKTEGALTTVGFESSNAGTQSTSASAYTQVSGTFYNYGFWVKTESTSDTTATITPYRDGAAGTAQTITLAGLEEMHFIIGVKSDGSAEEAFSIDYLKVVQIR